MEYEVYYGTTSDDPYFNAVDTFTGLTATITGLNEGTIYYLAVRGTDNTGQESDFSTEVSTATTPIHPRQPHPY